MNIWQHFADHFGAGHLLPIALAGDGTETSLAAGSLGKVPSVYNAAGKIVGFKSWQDARATKRELEKWANDGRYGFGVLLGRELPAAPGAVAVCIDVDTENPHYQETIHALLLDYLGVAQIPQRVRENSNRRAYVIAVRPRADERILKRVLRLPDNAAGKREAVEILGYGQQFAAHGRHPSGFDLLWLNGAADDFTAEPLLPVPENQIIEHSDLDLLIAAIQDELPVLIDTQSTERRQRNSTGVDLADDDVAVYLDDEGYTLSVADDGARRIRSPFAAEYSSEQGENDSSVIYYPPGNGYEQGHFVSLHASDAHRSDQEWLDAIGFVASQFDELPAIPEDAAGKALPPAPSLARDKNGRIEPDLPNLLQALRHHEWLGYDVRLDSFAGELVIGGQDSWRPFRDSDYTWLQVKMQALGFKEVPRDKIRFAVRAAAETRTIDTAQEWLKQLKWDGTPRIETFMQDYFSVPDSEYVRACSLYAWTAQAGRVMSPAIKADMMLVLVGDQGCGKSTGIAAISPNYQYFAEVSFSDNDADLARKIKGVLVAEFSEMNGLRTKAIEAIKAAVTRQHDKWVPKYQELPELYARRSLFWGTSNDEELLEDGTGHRRWLPMKVGAVNVRGIERDRDQLWAEARDRFLEDGVVYGQAQQLAKFEHENFVVTDDMESDVAAWLETIDDVDESSPAIRNQVRPFDAIAAMRLLGWEIQQNRSGQIRIAKLLKNIGYERFRLRIGDRLEWRYRRKVRKCPT